MLKSRGKVDKKKQNRRINLGALFCAGSRGARRGCTNVIFRDEWAKGGKGEYDLLWRR